MTSNTVRHQVAPQVGFGTIHGSRHVDPDRLIEDIRQAEALGYDMFTMSDHLHTEHPTYEPWTVLTWAAARN